MPSRKWRLLVFVMAFTCVVPHRSVAGPVFCTPVKPPIPRPDPLSYLFPRSVASPQMPTTGFHLGGVDLTHITPPPEFRAHDPKTADATGSRPANWYVAYPQCPVNWDGRPL